MMSFFALLALLVAVPACETKQSSPAVTIDGGIVDSSVGDGLIGDGLISDALTGLLTERVSCDHAPTPGAETAPDPAALGYSGGQCPRLVVGLNRFVSGSITRSVTIVAPSDASALGPLPLVFLWHWLGGSATDLAALIDIEEAVETFKFVAIMPSESQRYGLHWPILAADDAESELLFFDDLLFCIASPSTTKPFQVNKECVSSVGFGVGALWTAQLASMRGEYLSSIVASSGGIGLGFASTVLGSWSPPKHKMPAMVLWGGSRDQCTVAELSVTDPFRFDESTQAFAQALESEGHFLVECIHNCGHAAPPLIDERTPFASIWEFIFHHPFWLIDGDSWYLSLGLDQTTLPSWCSVASGSAIERNGFCGQAFCQ